MLIAHGGPGLHHGVYRTLDPLGDGRRLVFWDHRGHGRSGPLPDGPVSMELFADDAIALADSLGLETFAVFGHSFGGWVALELAIRHPDRVTALIVAATTPGQLGSTESPDDDQGPPPPAEVVELLSTLPSTDEGLIDTSRGSLRTSSRRRHPRLRRRAGARPGERRQHAARVRRAGTVERRRPPRRHLLSDVDPGRQARCLLLTQQLMRIATRIPDADLVVFEQSGHFMWQPRADRFFPLVSDWLDDNQPG